MPVAYYYTRLQPGPTQTQTIIPGPASPHNHTIIGTRAGGQERKPDRDTSVEFETPLTALASTSTSAVACQGG